MRHSDVVITKVVTRKMIKSLDETLELYKSRAVEFTEEEFETLSEFYSYLKQVLDYSKELHSLVNSDNSKWIDGMKEDTYYTEKMFSSFSTYK